MGTWKPGVVRLEMEASGRCPRRIEFHLHVVLPVLVLFDSSEAKPPFRARVTRPIQNLAS